MRTGSGRPCRLPAYGGKSIGSTCFRFTIIQRRCLAIGWMLATNDLSSCGRASEVHTVMNLYRSMHAFAGIFDRDCRLRHPCLKAGRNLGTLYFIDSPPFVFPLLLKFHQSKWEWCLFGFHKELSTQLSHHSTKGKVDNLLAPHPFHPSV